MSREAAGATGGVPVSVELPLKHSDLHQSGRNSDGSGKARNGNHCEPPEISVARQPTPHKTFTSFTAGAI
jgi:hypothetical protein